MPSFTIPTDYARLKFVNSFEELVTTRFENGVNALCWQRTLGGDFSEVVRALNAGEGITTLDEEKLRALPLGAEGMAAVENMLEDFRRLQNHGLSPSLDCIAAYPRDDYTDVVRTDVYSFHADSAPVEADTYLCTYYGATSEGLRNEEAIRKVDVPAIRAALLQRFGGNDDASFAEYLNEHCYDLHYAPAPSAKPFSFGLGNLWRITVDYPDSPVPPCVHRAPDNLPGQPPRLLLIS